MSDLLVPDVSQFQNGIDHPTVVGYLRSTCGGAAIIVRICYGDLLVDTQADANIDGFRAAGADALGWYLYLVAGRDPAAQAATLARVILAHGGLRRNEFVVVDDEESTGGDESARVNAALAELDDQLKTADPAGEDWWYSGLNFAALHNLPAARGHRWIAAYQGSEPTSIAHDLWQRTDAASFPGISGPVDASVYHGNINDFLALIGGHGMADGFTDQDRQMLSRLTTDFFDGSQSTTYDGKSSVPADWPNFVPATLNQILDGVKQLAARQDPIPALAAVHAELDQIKAEVEAGGNPDAASTVARIEKALATAGTSLQGA